VLAQLVQDLVHLEGRGQRLDEHRGLDRPARHPERPGREEHVVPEAGLEVVLHLGEVEVGASAAGELLLRVVEEEEAEVEEPAGDVPPVDEWCRSSGAIPEGARRAPRLALSRYCLPDFGSVNSMRRRTASMRLICPVIWFDQVGELASSKSAMNTFAPEFRALMIILRSTGPVISTLRSSRSAGSFATFQSPALTEAVSGRKSHPSAVSKPFARARRAARSSSTRPPKVLTSDSTKASAAGVSTVSKPGSIAPPIVKPVLVMAATVLVNRSISTSAARKIDGFCCQCLSMTGVDW
jgi:hypothetical protein